MEVSVESTSTIERKLTVVVPAGEVDSKVKSKVKETQQKARLPGFRPGKIPEREIRRRFGASIRQEVLGEVVQDAYFNALNEQDIQPVDQPQINITTNESGQDLQFVATVEVYPQVTVEGLDQLEIEKITAEIGETDIDEMVKQLREQRASWQEKEGAAEEGDKLSLDYAGSIDGEAFEGGTAEGQSLELGSKSMIPGFEDQLVGVTAGEERTLEVTFPEDYQAENLRGKAAQFKTTVHKVESKQLPELNEELFEQFGVTEGGEEAFRKEVAKNMEQQRKAKQESIFSFNATVQLVKFNNFEVPNALVQREARNQRDQALQQIFGQIPEQIKSNPDLLPYTGFVDKAKHNVQSGLILLEIIKQQSLEATPELVDAKLAEICDAYEDPDAMKQLIKSNKEQLGQVEQQVLEELVMTFIAEQATVTEKQVSFKELVEYQLEEIKPAAEEEQADDAQEEPAAEQADSDASDK